MKNVQSFQSFCLCFLLLLVSGCVVRHGVQVADFGPAQSPEGVAISMLVKADSDVSTNQGELLTVREDGVFILWMNRITFIAYKTIQDVEVTGMKRIRFGNGETPSPELREELRLISRYPQGMGDQLLENMLDYYSQEQVDLIE